MPASVAIVNPTGGGGRARLAWERAEETLRTLGDLHVRFTRAPGDGRRLAREAREEGVERLVIAGGDGTASEVISGLLDLGAPCPVELGYVPLGTGCDLARNLGVPRSPPYGVPAWEGSAAQKSDALRITYRDREGAPACTYALSVASVGLSGHVNELVARMPKRLGGRVTFGAAALVAVVQHRMVSIDVRLDGERVHSGPLTLAAIANGPCYGAGMWIAPLARMDDGVLEVVVVGCASRLTLLRNLPRLLQPSPILHPEIHYLRGRRVELEALEPSVGIDADGEILGTLPAQLEVVPGALRWIGVPPREPPSADPGTPGPGGSAT